MRKITVYIYLLVLPYMGVLGQDNDLAENFPESMPSGIEKMELLKKPAFTEDSETRKKVKITLLVDVEGLLKDSVAANIYRYCTLSDNNSGYSDSKNSKDFLSKVYGGRRVKWKGSSKNDIGSITIVEIRINPGDPILFKKGRTLKRKFCNIGGGVKNEEDFDEQPSHYSITFKVKKDQRKYGTFTLDPKLRANAKRTSQ